MLEDTYSYTLSTIPIQIIDVYDSNMSIRPRNSIEFFGYFQTSPNKLQFNNIEVGGTININYYETPTDYLIDDELVVPPSLLSALQFYVTHKAFEIYKAESDMFTSVEYYKKYKSALQDYLNKSDSTDVDSVVSLSNKIWKRGIR